jgi:hypothetical protein
MPILPGFILSLGLTACVSLGAWLLRSPRLAVAGFLVFPLLFLFLAHVTPLVNLNILLFGAAATLVAIIILILKSTCTTHLSFKRLFTFYS